MENKYYTPEISELYIGFECEITWDKFNTEVKAVYNDWVDDTPTDAIEWSVQKIELLHIEQFQNRESEYNSFDIRVKCLDKFDIEELGFKSVFENEDCVDFYFQKDNVELFIKSDNNSILKQIRIIISENTYTTDDFRIYIKNKSELKRILKMLNL